MATYKGHLSAIVRLRGGARAAGMSINIYDAGTTNKATLYRQRAGTTAIANPVTADAEGRIDVYLAPGEYDLTGDANSGVAYLSMPVMPDAAELALAVDAAGGAGGALAGASVALTGATAGADVLTAKVTADAASRVVMDADGTLTLGDGTGAGDTNLYRSAANTLKTDDALVVVGNLTLPTAGTGIAIKEGGAAAKMGTGTLDGATEVTIATTAVTANSRIFLSIQAPGGTPLGVIYVSARSAGVSFGVKGAATDTSTFAWEIREPAA